MAWASARPGQRRCDAGVPSPVEDTALTAGHLRGADPTRPLQNDRDTGTAGAGVAAGSATALGTSSTAAKTALSAGLLFKCVAAVGVASVVAVVAVGTGLVPRPFAVPSPEPSALAVTSTSAQPRLLPPTLTPQPAALLPVGQTKGGD